MKILPIFNRSLLQISGLERISFLQGLLSNDIKKLESPKPHQALYALLLTPQGKFLYDMFCYPSPDGTALWLETDSTMMAGLQQRLTMYKLRADVSLTPVEGQHLYACPDAPVQGYYYRDPRHPLLGWRLVSANASLATEPAEAYDLSRLRLGIPDGAKDLVSGESLPLYFAMDKLHAIDFHKGCYVGQEVTARTKHRATIRKALHLTASDTETEPSGTTLTYEGKPVGALLSGQNRLALALLRTDILGDGTEVRSESQHYRIIGTAPVDSTVDIGGDSTHLSN